jgi:UDP-glucose 6-dehydrogenase
MGLQEHGLEALLAGAQADDSERASFNDEELRTFYDRPRAHRLSNLCFTRDARAAIGRAQVIFICIDTPMDVSSIILSRQIRWN